MYSINRNLIKTLPSSDISLVSPRRNRPIYSNPAEIGDMNGWDYYKNRPARLLVVDDDDVDRERLNRYIKRSNLPIEVTNAVDGNDALDKINHSEIDVVLLDYHLGDMTGAELLEKIWHGEKKEIHIIMVTGMGSEQTAIEAIRLGVFDYVTKQDITASSLSSMLSSVLHASLLKQQLNQSQEQLKRLSFYDTLTGLPNRNLFFDRLQQTILAAERNKQSFTVLMIDLNLFKEVNDNYGHQAGDQVLHSIGQRLLDVARKSDTFARIGGDEFACILQNISDDEGATTCAEKISTVLAEPLTIDGRLTQIGASIGIAHYPEHGTEHTTLLSNADSAMYRAKRGHLKYKVYTNSCDSHINKVPVALHLHKGMSAGELFLEYQPKISLSNNRVIGAEVLVRWDSPQFGIIMPGDFIGYAERSNLIEELTYLTFEMALDQLQQWQSKLPLDTLSINLTARMLGDPVLLGWLKDAVTSRAIAPGMVVLEITETALAASSQSAQQMLSDMVLAGFKISIDDFGAGFTAFQSIRNVDISELKIDRVFVEKIHQQSRDAAIVYSVLTLAKSLGIPVVAEGVESHAQLKQLKELGCDYAQGYGIARPMRAELFEKWCDKKNKSSY